MLSLLISLVFSTYSYAAQLKVYKVNNIHQGGSLYMRSSPNHKAKVIVAIPHNAQWLESKDPSIQRGPSKWQKVIWNGNYGWVNTRYLSYDAKNTKIALTQRKRRTQPVSTLSQQNTMRGRSRIVNKQPATLQCGGHTPFWNIKVNLSAKRMKVTLNDGTAPYYTPVAYKKWHSSINKMVIHSGRGRNAVRAILYKTNNCTDGITSIIYPYKITANIDANKNMNGCCRIVATR